MYFNSVFMFVQLQFEDSRWNFMVPWLEATYVELHCFSSILTHWSLNKMANILCKVHFLIEKFHIYQKCQWRLCIWKWLLNGRLFVEALVVYWKLCGLLKKERSWRCLTVLSAMKLLIATGWPISAPSVQSWWGSQSPPQTFHGSPGYDSNYGMFQ